MTCPAVVKVTVPSGPAVIKVTAAAAPAVVRVATPGPIGPQGPQGVAGPAGSTTLAALTDVNTTAKAQGSVLYYDQGSGKWKGDDVNTLVTITDGGNF